MYNVKGKMVLGTYNIFKTSAIKGLGELVIVWYITYKRVSATRDEI